jgi:hypothetical protein
MSNGNDDAIYLIDNKLKNVSKELETARALKETHLENAERAQQLIELHEGTVRRLEGSRYLLQSQPPLEIHDADG